MVGESPQLSLDEAVAWCGTAKTYPHGWMFLETGIRLWQADSAFAGGDYRARPKKAQGCLRCPLGIVGLLPGVVAPRPLSPKVGVTRGPAGGVDRRYNRTGAER